MGISAIALCIWGGVSVIVSLFVIFSAPKATLTTDKMLAGYSAKGLNFRYLGFNAAILVYGLAATPYFAGLCPLTGQFRKGVWNAAWPALASGILLILLILPRPLWTKANEIRNAFYGTRVVERLAQISVLAVIGHHVYLQHACH